MIILQYFIYYLLIINIITFIFYGIDKLKAKRGGRRIRELTLFNLALFGGGLGGILGMFIFNHKTKIKRFAIINIGMIIFYLIISYYFGEYVWN